MSGVEGNNGHAQAPLRSEKDARWTRSELAESPGPPLTEPRHCCYVAVPGGAGMRRRQFIGLVGGVAVWPVAVQAQLPTVPVVGYLSARSAEVDVPMMAALRQGLA